MRVLPHTTLKFQTKLGWISNISSQLLKNFIRWKAHFPNSKSKVKFPGSTLRLRFFGPTRNVCWCVPLRHCTNLLGGSNVFSTMACCKHRFHEYSWHYWRCHCNHSYQQLLHIAAHSWHSHIYVVVRCWEWRKTEDPWILSCSFVDSLTRSKQFCCCDRGRVETQRPFLPASRKAYLDNRVVWSSWLSTSYKQPSYKVALGTSM